MANLVEEHPDLDAEAAREALVGNICRCTGYVRIVAALLDAGRRVREEPDHAGASAPPAAPRTPGDADGR
jgi:xanthine dehydrogenase iron-sulfur cluster and FAD-binding subunit A